jgi:DNA-binding transcriptional ArsR family regulator
MADENDTRPDEAVDASDAETVATTDTKVSQAMRLLRNAGVVRNRRDGRNIFYRLDDAHVRMLLDLSREHLAHSRDER